jgi:prepilin-type N-terminal cleavage/methylation domain-containing protein
MRSGHTLLELLTALILVAIAAAVLLPAGRDLRDAMAVAGAREAVAGLVSEARLLAQANGGAVVHLQAGPWRAWSEVGDSVVRVVRLEEDLKVTVELNRGRLAATLRYDGLGLGQVASQTVAFRRGAAERALVVSGYGRVRRR